MHGMQNVYEKGFFPFSQFQNPRQSECQAINDIWQIYGGQCYLYTTAYNDVTNGFKGNIDIISYGL